MGDLVLVRHGQTEWSTAGRHTSRTDLPLTPDGEREAQRLRTALASKPLAAVLSSPYQRSLRTAQLAGLTSTTADEDLAEWDYGDYEGLTSAQIREQRPGWSLWRDGCPGGESPEQVGARADRLLNRARQLASAGDVVLVGHGHDLRVVAVRWVGLPPAQGMAFYLGTATLSRLGYEHGQQVIRQWNAPVG